MAVVTTSVVQWRYATAMRKITGQLVLGRKLSLDIALSSAFFVYSAPMLLDITMASV